MFTLKVPDMSCGHCAQTVEKALKNLDPAARVEVDLTQKTVRVETVATEQKVAEAIRSAGYDNERLAA